MRLLRLVSRTNRTFDKNKGHLRAAEAHDAGEKKSSGHKTIVPGFIERLRLRDRRRKGKLRHSGRAYRRARTDDDQRTCRPVSVADSLTAVAQVAEKVARRQETTGAWAAYCD